MVLPEVQHWKLVESYRMQTLCERGIAADLDPSEVRLQSCKRRWLAWATTSLFLRGRRVLEKNTRTTPQEAQRPQEHGRAHRGEAASDQQGVHTRRDGERESCGDAGEYSERNSQSGLRRNQETPIRPVAGRRVHGQEQEPRIEEPRNLEQQHLCLRRAIASKRLAGWTKDCQLVCGRQQEKNLRGGRHGIHNERRQDVRRVLGWIG